MGFLLAPLAAVGGGSAVAGATSLLGAGLLVKSVRDASKAKKAAQTQPQQITPAPQQTVQTAPTATRIEVQEAEREQKIKASKRKGIRSTILAGEREEVPSLGKKTLLGG